jgi:hypothetical protein
MKERDAEPKTLAAQRNEALPKRIDQFPTLRDFYNTYDDLKVTDLDRDAFAKYMATLTDKEKSLLQSGLNFYVVDLSNLGGLVMPVILQIDYMDGTSEELRIPAEIWRYDSEKASKLIMTNKEIKSIALDPHLETADTDLDNNAFPRKVVKSRFELFKDSKKPNPMQQLERKPETRQQ